MDYRSPDSEALTRRRIQLLGDLYQRLGADTAVRTDRTPAAGTWRGCCGRTQGCTRRTAQECLLHTQFLIIPPPAVPAVPLPFPQSEAVIGEESRRDIKLADKDMQFANNMLTEFSLLLGRAWRNSSRNRPLQVVTAGQTVIIGLLLAWLYSDMSPTTASGVQDEIGIL
jgi:hypothetical protein